MILRRKAECDGSWKTGLFELNVSGLTVLMLTGTAMKTVLESFTLVSTLGRTQKAGLALVCARSHNSSSLGGPIS